MQIHKTLILDYLRAEGEYEKAEQVDAELPIEIDTETQKDVLDRFGLDAPAMIARLAGGGGLGNVPGS